ncbi:MAG: ribbon-helix-helix protein, CopG family [Nitrospirae bacterium]|nr:ribbon-helix-helix protein, CopG family [Nitrospirota bacterium]
MPAVNPRINVVVEKSLYEIIRNMAKKNGVSMAMVMRDLVREAVELREDESLVAWAEEREKKLKGRRLLSHKEVWG